MNYLWQFLDRLLIFIMLWFFVSQLYLFSLIPLELLYDLIGIKLKVVYAQLHINLVILLIKALSDLSELFEHDFLLFFQLFGGLIAHLLEMLVFEFFFLKESGG